MMATAKTPVSNIQDAKRARFADFTGEAEQSLLGALVLDGKALDRIPEIRPQHFSDERHREIFAAILDCAEDDGVDLVTLSERLGRNGPRDDGMAAYLAALAQNVPSALNIHRYAALVLDKAQRRDLAALGVELQDRANAPGVEVDDLRRDIALRLDQIPGAQRAAPLDLREMAATAPARPKFIIPDWLPAGYATLLAGHGGVGKSAIALNLAVCLAAGLPFFGLEVARRRVLYLSCEDRTDVLHWRLTRICAHLGVALDELDPSLAVFDLVGSDCVLWERDPRTGGTITAAYGQLRERMRRHEAEVLFVDGIADTFAGNENARGDVKRYVNSLVALVPNAGAVVLIGHIAKPAASLSSTSEGYSGSTAWHNSTRARWYLYPETAKGDDGERPERTGELMLELQKSNLGRTDQSIAFRWNEDAHLFLGERTEESPFDRKHQDLTERTAILRAMKGCADAGIVVPAALHGPRTIYAVLTIRPEFPESLRGTGAGEKRRLRRHIEELRQLHLIEETEYRRAHYKTGMQFSLTTEGVRQCAN